MSKPKPSRIAIISVLFFTLILSACIPDNGGSAAPTAALGHQTKSSGCVSKNSLPDPECTPGAIFPDATKEKICTPGYSKSVRNVPDDLKWQDYAAYGIAHHEPGEYDVDHLIPLGVGGSNDIANLWPEPAEPRPGFHEKDQVENYLHNQVCSGAIALEQAQIDVATNWLAIYQQMPR